MALSKALIKDLLKELPQFNDSDLPTLEAKKEFIAHQLEGSQSMAYRGLVDIEVAKDFAEHKEKANNELAKNKIEENVAQLRALKPTIKVLQRVAKELESQTPEEA